MKKPIYVVGHPRSGTTWLTRLLADVLNCPAGAGMPEKDAADIVTEGQGRPGKYVVRKGHFRLVDAPGKPFVYAPHKMNWPARKGEPIIFIIRDPRDIAVSRSFYFNRPLEKEIEKMGNWSEYVEKWIDFILVDDQPFYTFYEELLRATSAWLPRILDYLGELPAHWDRIENAVHRQSFAERKKWTLANLDKLPNGERHLKMLRKGIVGDWKNHFTPELEQMAKESFGEAMERLGYEW